MRCDMGFDGARKALVSVRDADFRSRNMLISGQVLQHAARPAELLPE